MSRHRKMKIRFFFTLALTCPWHRAQLNLVSVINVPHIPQ